MPILGVISLPPYAQDEEMTEGNSQPEAKVLQHNNSQGDLQNEQRTDAARASTSQKEEEDWAVLGECAFCGLGHEHEPLGWVVSTDAPFSTASRTVSQ